MSYETYKILHVVGILSLFTAFGALLLHALQKGPKKYAQKRLLAITHGTALTLVLVSGFGLLARLGITTGVWPGWVFAKIGIWLVAGGLMAVIPRKPEWAQALWGGVLALGGLAAWIAVTKPF